MKINIKNKYMWGQWLAVLPWLLLDEENKTLKKKNDVMVKISERFLSELEIPFIPKKWYVIYLHKPTPSQRPKVLDVEVEPTLYVSLDHHWNFEWVRPIHI